MATNVLPSQGTAISLKVGSAFVKIAGVTNFDGLGSGSAAVIDTTDLDSTAKEKQMGVPDEGQIKIDVNYIAADAGQSALDAARVARALTDFKVVVGSGATAVTWTYQAFVLSFAKSAGVDKQWTGSASLEISGPVTKTIGVPA